jgi:hypothetical protein
LIQSHLDSVGSLQPLKDLQFESIGCKPTNIAVPISIDVIQEVVAPPPPAPVPAAPSNAIANVQAQVHPTQPQMNQHLPPSQSPSLNSALNPACQQNPMIVPHQQPTSLTLQQHPHTTVHQQAAIVGTTVQAQQQQPTFPAQQPGPPTNPISLHQAQQQLPNAVVQQAPVQPGQQQIPVAGMNQQQQMFHQNQLMQGQLNNGTVQQMSATTNNTATATTDTYPFPNSNAQYGQPTYNQTGSSDMHQNIYQQGQVMYNQYQPQQAYQNRPQYAPQHGVQHRQLVPTPAIPVGSQIVNRPGTPQQSQPNQMVTNQPQQQLQPQQQQAPTQQQQQMLSNQMYQNYMMQQGQVAQQQYAMAPNYQNNRSANTPPAVTTNPQAPGPNAQPANVPPQQQTQTSQQQQMMNRLF